jgi:general secretion pathway protein B
MSFILDALKKSEIERQRQSVPGLMETGRTPPRARLPVWAVLLAVLLIVNIIVLTVVLMRRDAPPVPGKPPLVASAPESAAVSAHFSPLDSAPVYAPEIPVPPADLAGGTAPRTATHSALRRPEPVLHATAPSDDDEEVLPTVNEVSLTGAQALPELHLDVHVYATSPADRFVYINMRKYHEGDRLQEGPTVERIRRDGVVLNLQGLRFILPRQS